MHPITNRRAVLSLAAHAALFCTALMIAFGPLTPPSGAVSSTAKPLSEVEPRIALNAANTPGDSTSIYRINQPGSYYLTANVAGVSGKHGIKIAAAGVTVDLCGFTLTGVPGSLDGVTIAGGLLGSITVQNGSARSWGGSGINLSNSSPTNCHLQNLHSAVNGAAGIIGSLNTTILDCEAQGNGTIGIQSNWGSVIRSCAAANNGAEGFSLGMGSVLSACSAFNNSGVGIRATIACNISGCSSYLNMAQGIVVESDCTIERCSLRANLLDDISVGNGCFVLDNVCNFGGNGSTDGAGIHATGGFNRIENNNCTNCDRGVDLDAGGNIVLRNSCSNNTVNYDIGTGNRILVVTAPFSSAFTGSAGGLGYGTTDPNANLSY